MSSNHPNQSTREDRAISSTVAVALLLAVTVVLVTVTGAFVFDLVESTKDNPVIPGNEDVSDQNTPSETVDNSQQERTPYPRYGYNKPENVEQYVYTVKFVCGVQPYNPLYSNIEVGSSDGQLTKVAYSTALNLYNYNNRDINLSIRGVSVPQPGEETGESAITNVTIQPHQTRELPCSEVFVGDNSREFNGIVAVQSPVRLNVLGVYTTYPIHTSRDGGAISAEAGPEIRVSKIEPEYITETNESTPESSPSPGIGN